MLRKCTTLLLAVLMLLSLAACGQPAPESQAAAQDPSSAPAQADGTGEEAPADDIMTPYGRYAETVTFTSGRVTAPKLPADQTYEDNVMMTYIEKVLNVKVENEWVVDDNNYDQKVALLLASGEIPDVMVVNDRKTLQQMVDADLLEDLTESFDKCLSPFLREQYDSFGDNLLEEATFDGKLMAVPGTNIGGAHNLIWIRNDWLEKVDMDPPETIDDIIAIAQTFIEQDPGGNGAGKTVGITGKQRVAGQYNAMHGWDTIFSLYGAYPRHWIDDGAGGAVYGSVAPEMKEALAKLNEMYEAGVLDPQFAMRQEADSHTLVTSGQCGIMFGPWWAAYDPLSNSVANDPTADWKPYLAPVDGSGKLNVYTQDPVNKFLVVRKGYEHPEAIIKVLNCENDLYRGTNPEAAALMQEVNAKGDDWGEPFVLQVDYNDAVYRYYTELMAAIEADDPSALPENYVGAFNAWKTNTETPGADSAAWAEATARVDGQALTYIDEVVFHDDVFYGTTPAMEMKWATMEKYEDETLIQFIMGAKSLDEFDDYAAQWMSLGGEEVTAEVTAAVKG